MDVFFSLRDGKRFAAVGRDEIELAGGVVFRVGVGIVAAFIGGSLALGEEGDPASVRRPLGFGVVAGLRELD